MGMQQVAVRQQSKTFTRNAACRAGTAIGLLSPPPRTKADKQSVCSILKTKNILFKLFGKYMKHFDNMPQEEKDAFLKDIR